MTSEPLALVRYLDVAIVVMAAPFAIAFGLPALGYAVGAVGWIAQRIVQVAVDRRARRAATVQRAAFAQLAGAMGRAWAVALTILAVGLAADREDGATAAGLVLVAYTVYLGTLLLSHRLERSSSPR